MRINNRTNPALNILNEKCNDILIRDFDKEAFLENRKEIHNLLFKYRKYFKSEVLLISDSFLNATKKNIDKLSKLSNNDSIDLNGTYIFNKHLVMASFQHCVLFVFDKKGVLMSCFKKNIGEKDFLIESRDEKVITERVIKNLSLSEGLLKTIISCDLFKKYADVETKILKAKTKTKIFNCKYINDTDFNITHLDSRWFTDLIQSNSFNVRGHFRLQPYKFNKRLIWIDEFKKNGYTSKAKKNTHKQ